MDPVAAVGLALRIFGMLQQVRAAQPPQPSQPPPSVPEYSLKWVQDGLNKINNAGLTVDGINGPATIKAVMDYQQKKGLAVDGWAGVQTCAALQADLDKLVQHT